ncbi:hypothetical protein CEXT_779821 [Caerostris extrusa]|uniref:Uncharacterized protein n=1 Tax=Caerostris extrusa TaxID=172846 RepID=A0AAV4NED7_CAEEX|nr:hypothetical protein CEXT_779821 [Caerostris extrusa]
MLLSRQPLSPHQGNGPLFPYINIYYLSAIFLGSPCSEARASPSLLVQDFYLSFSRLHHFILQKVHPQFSDYCLDSNLKIHREDHGLNHCLKGLLTPNAIQAS